MFVVLQGLFLISAVLQGTSAWLFQKKTAVCQPVGSKIVEFLEVHSVFLE